MTRARQMIGAHPAQPVVSAAVLAACIDACYECAQACTACADTCLAEEELPMLVRCIRLNLDCADVCSATGSLLSRQTELEPPVARALVQTCVAACRVCAAECDRHADHMAHCRICAESCRDCERACDELLGALPR